MYYWTINVDTPAVYHNNTACFEGKKILAKDKQTGSTPPAGRRLCEVC